MIIPNGTTLYVMTEAEKLRQKAIGEIADVLSSTVSRDTRREAAEAIYDAGYRKFEIVEEDV